ncbi:hypothetical protein CCUS01_08807 [Colletotrichum cuscutae]|uniref:Uncharacterized protein n=1 Tax=Colletotrichum cuscutae TaxID=1209917 RepID=A0AAI9UNL0_9PEZI|nr:hypothetical protein CCUS01_08807 [Colletotrichum cuscutae]
MAPTSKAPESASPTTTGPDGDSSVDNIAQVVICPSFSASVYHLPCVSHPSLLRLSLSQSLVPPLDASLCLSSPSRLAEYCTIRLWQARWQLRCPPLVHTERLGTCLVVHAVTCCRGEERRRGHVGARSRPTRTC